ncbi:MAG: iron-sulfur cluster assembly accessory protein [Verrucomicrobia bacterium]|nr:iron-sulfur cluster assembly accessory protein [Verrucomicrobiota bacterium]
MNKTLPEGVRLGNDRLIHLTESAAEKTNTLLANEPEGSLLRVKISGGGCNGLSYKLDFVNTFKRGDIVVESSGAQVVVDSKSALYLRGTTLIYSNALVAGGFKFENPNAKSSCSCGESFSV